MRYYFSYVIRSDDYYPVYNRQSGFEQTVREIFHLDASARIEGTTAEKTPEGTGNLCTFVSEITAGERPDSWLAAAVNYAKLRDIDFEVTLTEYVEPEPEPEPATDKPENASTA
jgi:hypothetical protein